MLGLAIIFFKSGVEANTNQMQFWRGGWLWWHGGVTEPKGKLQSGSSNGSAVWSWASQEPLPRNHMSDACKEK